VAYLLLCIVLLDYLHLLPHVQLHNHCISLKLNVSIAGPITAAGGVPAAVHCAAGLPA
jgi:hypothetical protein